MRRCQLGGITYDTEQIEATRERDVDSGEIEEAGKQSGESVGLAHNKRCENTVVAGGLGGQPQLLDRASDRSEWILDLMCHRGAELGDRFQTLRAQMKPFDFTLVQTEAS